MAADDAESDISRVVFWVEGGETPEWLGHALDILAPRVGIRFAVVANLGRAAELTRKSPGGGMIVYGPQAPSRETVEAWRNRVSGPSGPIAWMWRAPGETASLRELPRRLDAAGRPHYACRPGADELRSRVAENVHHVAADLVFMAWWVASRREERECPLRDRHDRVPSRASYQVEMGDLERPVLDGVAASLREALTSIGIACRPARPWGEATSAVCLTHDIDSIAKFASRRRAAGVIWREGTAHPGRLARQAIGRALGRDPHTEALKTIGAEAEEGLRPTMFVMTGGTHDLDPGYDPSHPALGEIAAGVVDGGGEVGIHPSYDAGRSPELLKGECDTFERVFARPAEVARLHYLRWEPHRTPRLLREVGIRTDATLGWPESPGFRCGTALPLPVWHPAREEPMEIDEVPMTMMDTSVILHQALSPDAAMGLLERLASEVSEARGILQLLHHPHLACDVSSGREWETWWGDAIAMLRERQALFLSVGEAADRWRETAHRYSTEFA